jgi:hypothetical protein
VEEFFGFGGPRAVDDLVPRSNSVTGVRPGAAPGLRRGKRPPWPDSPEPRYARSLRAVRGRG